jgi:AcrR family transcriptional regulator
VKRGRKPGDHDSKKVEIAEAAYKTLLRVGIANASLADIAREMGYTTGVLRHYFKDKEELLLFTKNMLFDRASERARAAAEGVQGLERLRIMVTDSLSLDQDTVDRWRLLTMFSGQAIGDARLMALQQKRNERFWQLLEEELSQLQQAGYLASQMDAALEARGLVAFSDGLADQIIMKPKAWTTAQLQTLVSNYLDGFLARCGRREPATRKR